MAVFRWGNPLHSLPDLEREMDRWMKSMDLAFEGLRLGRPFPALNVYATADAYLITAELPGCDVKDLEIHVADGKLTVSGVRSPQADVPADRFRRSERASGAWERIVALPERVDEHHIGAELTNGLLRVTLPKLPATAPRHIKLNDAPASAESSANPA
ncbi:Hsp20/alpha crystallin family protein [Planctomicrobium piriforme]|uniref:HSP20 family protein n=1 Tax=Planctomicrobium piriforme TaxID=1576369 RepID=A0A1I3DMX4_9PLAN|nr:Hsp20/alpha crystallin family protein [Planctomicrobium piriforme]SFH88077.1 HSP20 family protein [Planctomicrobium piriforme]